MSLAAKHRTEQGPYTDMLRVCGCLVFDSALQSGALRCLEALCQADRHGLAAGNVPGSFPFPTHLT